MLIRGDNTSLCTHEQFTLEYTPVVLHSSFMHALIVPKQMIAIWPQLLKRWVWKMQ